MRAKDLAGLNRIARMRREIALAELAARAAEAARLSAARAELAEAAQLARRDGQGSVVAAQAAEQFSHWVDGQDAALRAALAEAEALKAAQRAVAAQAVGRQQVLEQITDRLRKGPRR